MDESTATPIFVMAKNVNISIWPHNGSISLPHRPTMMISKNTSQRYNSRKQNVNAVQMQNDGGKMNPGVTLKTFIAVSENDRTYPKTVTIQMNFTEVDVFSNNADICWVIYGKFRDSAIVSEKN